MTATTTARRFLLAGLVAVALPVAHGVARDGSRPGPPIEQHAGKHQGPPPPGVQLAGKHIGPPGVQLAGKHIGPPPPGVA